MAPKKRHLLDILRDNEAREGSTEGSGSQQRIDVVPSGAAIKPKISAKVLALIFAGVVVFFFSYKFAGDVSGVDNYRYCVVAREFNSEDFELARKLGTELRSQGYNVTLAEIGGGSGKSQYKLFIGNQPSEAALSETLASLQALTLDGLGGANPFSNARIKPLPKN
jgi:hypothetical protein